jgi:hypothetical protein
VSNKKVLKYWIGFYGFVASKSKNWFQNCWTFFKEGKAPTSCLGANFSRRRENPFKKLLKKFRFGVTNESIL